MAGLLRRSARAGFSDPWQPRRTRPRKSTRGQLPESAAGRRQGAQHATGSPIAVEAACAVSPRLTGRVGSCRQPGPGSLVQKAVLQRIRHARAGVGLRELAAGPVVDDVPYDTPGGAAWTG